MPLAVVFDLDGTLVDSRDDIVFAMQHALAEAGLAPRTGAQIASHVGDGTRHLVARSADLPLEHPLVEELLATFLRTYTANPTRATRVLPGVRETLAALAGRPLGVCTNKARATTGLVLANLDLARHFRAVVAGGDTPVHKPDPLPFLRVVEQLGVPPERAVMVGDGPQDILSGRGAGARTIGVRGGGLIDEQRLVDAQPDALVAHMSEVVDLILRWEAEDAADVAREV